MAVRLTAPPGFSDKEGNDMAPGDSQDPQPGVEPVVTSRDETRAFYNKIARVYNTLSARWEAPMCGAGLDMLAVREGERVVDLGCGTGRSLPPLVHAAGESGWVAGVDLSENMLAETRAFLNRQDMPKAAALCQADAIHLPFPSGSLDAVFTSFTLELFDTPEIPVVLAECRRVLRPGGRAAVVSVSREGKSALVAEVYEWFHRRFPRFLDCRPIHVRNALESAGFEVQHARMKSMVLPVEIAVAANPD